VSPGLAFAFVRGVGACAGYRVYDVIKERYGTVLPLLSSVRS
jgi:hypothetical protein